MSKKIEGIDPAAFIEQIAQRAEGHSPGYDIALYARPAQWKALTKYVDHLREEVRLCGVTTRDIDERNVEIDRLRNALQGLVDRLDFIHEDPVFNSVWTMYQIHFGPYSGPTYVDALTTARQALTNLTEETT